MNSKWILNVCAVGVLAIAQAAHGQTDCGCQTETGQKVRKICQGYSQARAEALWAGYCGEKCWGDVSGETEDCGGFRGFQGLRGNCGCKGKSFGWPGNRCGRGCVNNCSSGCDNDCNQGCNQGCGGFNIRLGCFTKRERCNPCGGHFAFLKGLSLGRCNDGCKQGCFRWGNQKSCCASGCGGLQLLGRFGCQERCRDRCKDGCGILANLRGMFQRSGYGCCDKGCNSGCGDAVSSETKPSDNVEPPETACL